MRVYVTVSGMRTVLRVCVCVCACLRTTMTLSPCRIRMCALQGLPKCRLLVSCIQCGLSVGDYLAICGMDLSFDVQ